VPLRIAAKVDPVDRDYFETVIRPLLDDPLIELVGEVGEEGKSALLGGALALLFPIDWPEPFGLVMIESLACGTPVIARPRGSVREVIAHGETGWVCETEDDMVEAVRRIAEIDRADCRAAFDRQFTVETMAKRYLDVYEAVRVARAQTDGEHGCSAPTIWRRRRHDIDRRSEPRARA
jgi:glycosyltransferase involved in cell wall biosynthesis